MIDLDSDHLAVWPLIMERIEDVELCPGLRAVRQVDELVAALAGGGDPIDRAAYVGYDGETLGAGDGEGFDQIVRQRYTVGVAVRFARAPRGREGRGSIAGPLISQVIGALSGWTPPGLPAGMTLRRVTGQAASYPPQLPGWGMFPTTWELVFATQGVDDHD